MIRALLCLWICTGLAWADEAPRDPVVSYNLGTSLHRKQQYEPASQALGQAVASGSPALQSRAAYNLGNTHYRQAQAQEQGNPAAAMALYRKALDDYRVAIRASPKDRDAQFNYELAQHRLTQLKAQQQQSSEGQASQDHQPPQQSAENQAPQENQESRQEESRQASGRPQETEVGEPGGERQAPSGTPKDRGDAGKNDQEPSKQEALWILDALRQEEQGALTPRQRTPAHERPVEKDW